MGELIFLIVIGTSIWVYFDSKSIGVKKGQLSGIANMGPPGWFFCCLLLWIIAFPLYLSKRNQYKQIASTPKQKILESSPKQFSACGKYHEGSPAYCPNCGQQLIGERKNN